MGDYMTNKTSLYGFKIPVTVGLESSELLLEEVSNDDPNPKVDIKLTSSPSGCRLVSAEKTHPPRINP